MEAISSTKREAVSAGSHESTRLCPTDLRSWLDTIERAGQLKRIKEPVDLVEELSAITYLTAQRDDAPALLFEAFSNHEGSGAVLTNMLGSSSARFALSVGLDPTLPVSALIEQTRAIMLERRESVHVAPDAAPVNEVVLTGDDVDLTKLPVPQFWPGDGGRYIGTGDITFTRNPDNDRLNVGVYRQMLHGPRQVGMYCSPGKHGKIDREAWWQRGEACEVVVAYGVDPILFMVGAQTVGFDESELDLAGGLMGAPVRLTEGVTGSLPLPADAEIVIEGLVHEGDEHLEGPLGEFTGYYGNPRAPQPVIEVKALHMRRSPILTAALMAAYPACEIGAYYAVMRSALVWNELNRMGVPGIRGVYAHPAAASGWGMLVVSIDQQYPGHVAQALALAGQCPAAAYYTKWIVAVDADVDPTDLNQVLWAMSTRCSPMEDIDIQRRTWSTGLDPSRGDPGLRRYGSKAYIDACVPHRYRDDFPKRTLLRRSVYEQVARKWRSLGLDGEPPVPRAFHKEDD